MATVYVRNLDEKINLSSLKEHLEQVMGKFGASTVYAKKSLKMRGQAFVDFESPQSANEAIVALNDTEMFGRKVIVQEARARSRGVREGAPAKRRKLSPHNILFIAKLEDHAAVKEKFATLEGFVEARLAKNVGFIEFDTAENAAKGLGLFGAEYAAKDE